jgi:hypothetical protein
MSSYADFLAAKMQLGGNHGFVPDLLPPFLYDFQRGLVAWALHKGRAAIFADCGLGKTPMQLVWADEVARRMDRPVLLVVPLAVSYQVEEEAEKFGIGVGRSQDGTVSAERITVTNYERLHHFSPDDFVGAVCDESSILKSFDGKRKAIITEFLRTLPLRLLCTATAAPNDYIELGTSSEALGDLGHMDMLARYFVNDRNNSANRRHFGKQVQWRFKGHAEEDFWRWVCSWARAIRRPSDLGFDDGPFKLPPLREREHLVEVPTGMDGRLFDQPAETLADQREEARRSLPQRCARVAELVDHGEQALVWCHLNAEADELAKLIPDAEQVAGSDRDEVKESRLHAFARGDLRVLVTKPKIGAWGLNLQNCAHITFFPSHSYEQYYQGVRRCWRFGQTRPVTVDIVASAGERGIRENLRRKSEQADRMFEALLRHMNDAIEFEPASAATDQTEVPAWL